MNEKREKNAMYVNTPYTSNPTNNTNTCNDTNIGILSEPVHVSEEDVKAFYEYENCSENEIPNSIKHGICVSNMAYRISKELGFDEDFCYQIALAGIVHDIGKIRLSEYVKKDNDTLTVKKLRYIRMHPKLGYEIIKSHGFSEFIQETVLYHHENFDGSGYPENLSAENIPIGARILRVCDVFSALISDRSYRKAFDVETAVELMIDEVKNFDMQIFLAFMRVVHENILDIQSDSCL